MPADILITTRRIEPGEQPLDPIAKPKALVKCMQCGQAWTCERDTESVETGRAHTAETGHTRLLIVRSVPDAA